MHLFVSFKRGGLMVNYVEEESASAKWRLQPMRQIYAPRNSSGKSTRGDKPFPKTPYRATMDSKMKKRCSNGKLRAAEAKLRWVLRFGFLGAIATGLALLRPSAGCRVALLAPSPTRLYGQRPYGRAWVDFATPTVATGRI